MNDHSENRNQNIDQPFDEERMEKTDAQNIQNCEESNEKNSQKLCQEIENSDQKEEISSQETESVTENVSDSASETPSLEETVEESVTENSDASPNATVQNPDKQKQYSCSYTPPYYVPNFNTVNSNTSSSERPKKKKKGVVLVCAIVACALLMSLVIGVFALAGYKLLNFPDSFLNGSSDDEMTVIKNDGSIKVNEQVGSTGYSNLSVSEVVDIVADSVVEITTSHVQTDFFYNSYVTSGAGSGVLIAERDNKQISYIITNYHVVEGSDQTIVRLKNGEEYEATLISGDADVDIAVLTIPAADLSYATLGSSESLQVGEEVVAIGNPLGQLGGTVTDGIISALDRSVIVDNHRMTLLQTNAAINPGNSGGGLFNMAGELIGIVNAKQSDTGIEGLGFAIPIDVAWDAAKDLIDYGYVVGKLTLGFEVAGKTEAFQMQQGNGLYSFPAGVYIVETSNNNLKAYDRIVSINGSEITDINDYYNAIDVLKKGDTMTMVISRLTTNGYHYSFQNKTVTITVAFTEEP